MQVPIGSELLLTKRPEGELVRPGSVVSGVSLSLGSQLKLREFYEYLENGRTALSKIRAGLSLLESDPMNSAYVKKVSDHLEAFCLDADCWGFNSLYEISQGLQMFLIKSGNRLQEGHYWGTLDKGLAMLAALLEQCEGDFRWALAIAEMLDCFDQVTGE
jgi:hypothetical protein